MERRRTERRVPAAEEPLSRVRLRTGWEVAVVNASNTGLLVEGVARLLPGTHVDVHVITRDGRVLVRSRVTRAYVSMLAADGIQYRGALAFDRVVDTSAVGYVFPATELEAPVAAGSNYPVVVPGAMVAFDDRLTA